MFATAAIAILVTMSLALLRAFMGPTLYDRILAVNMFGTKTVLIIAVLGFLMGRPDFLDIALVYALINFIGVIALLKYFKYGNLAIGPGETVGEKVAEPAEKSNSGSGTGDTPPPSRDGQAG
jgi:multicomponent Na+:H+ antiporter subunit F